MKPADSLPCLPETVTSRYPEPLESMRDLRLWRQWRNNSLFSVPCCLCLDIQPWRWRLHGLPKRSCSTCTLHGLTTQKPMTSSWIQPTPSYNISWRSILMLSSRLWSLDPSSGIPIKRLYPFVISPRPFYMSYPSHSPWSDNPMYSSPASCCLRFELFVALRVQMFSFWVYAS